VYLKKEFPQIMGNKSSMMSDKEDSWGKKKGEMGHVR
jgi:hypothetical protein